MHEEYGKKFMSLYQIHDFIQIITKRVHSNYFSKFNSMNTRKYLFRIRKVDSNIKYSIKDAHCGFLYTKHLLNKYEIAPIYDLIARSLLSLSLA